MPPDVKAVLARLRDERGLGDRVVLAREAADLMSRSMNELEHAYERLNQTEDLLSCALAHLEGDPGYANKDAILGDLRAYFEARKKRTL